MTNLRVATGGTQCRGYLLALLLAWPGVAAAEQVELWTWALRPYFDEFMHTAIDDFEAANPGVEVVWVDVPASAMRRKMFSAGAAGTLPDVINFSDQDFARFASLGALRPVAGTLPGETAGRYLGGALDAATVDGELMGLPWYLSTPVRLANTRLLAEGGLGTGDVGGEWADLLALAGPFHEATGSHLVAVRLGEQSDLPGMMLADGLEPIVETADGRRGNLTDPEIVALVSAWVEAFRASHLPRAAATGGYAGMIADYLDGRVAVVNANAAKSVADKAPAVYADTAVLPGVTGELGRAHIAATFLAVSAHTERPELAGRLAWHLSSPRWQTELAVLAGRLPSTSASLEDEAFAGDPAAASDTLRRATLESARQLPDARSFTPTLGVWPDLRAAFEDGMKRMLLDGADVAATLAEVNAEWDRILQADAEGLPYK